MSGITYVRTWHGALYLAVVVDCQSRRVVGWALADSVVFVDHARTAELEASTNTTAVRSHIALAHRPVRRPGE